MANNSLKLSLGTLFIFAMISSPITLLCEAETVPAPGPGGPAPTVPRRPFPRIPIPVCPRCLCCAPPPAPGKCCPCFNCPHPPPAAAQSPTY